MIQQLKEHASLPEDLGAVLDINSSQQPVTLV